MSSVFGKINSTLLDDGSSANPSLAFETNPDTGIYKTSSGIGVAIDGSNQMNITDSAIISSDPIETPSLKVSHTSNPNTFQVANIETRKHVADLCVPSIQPTRANTQIAFDVAPSASGLSDYFDNGVAWVDVCDGPVIDANPYNGSVLRLGNRGTNLEVGSRKFGSGTLKPLHFTMNASPRMIMNTSGQVIIGASAGNAPAAFANRQFFIVGSDAPSIIIEDTNSSTNKKYFEYSYNDDFARLIHWFDNASTYHSTLNSSYSGSRGNITVVAAQNSLGSPNYSAALQVDSTVSGFLPPRMTTAQRDAITSPPAGLIVYNTSTNLLNFYNGSAWGAI